MIEDAIVEEQQVIDYRMKAEDGKAVIHWRAISNNNKQISYLMNEHGVVFHNDLLYSDAKSNL